MSEQGTSETGGHVLAVELSLAPGATPRIGSPVQISIAVRNEADADVLMVGVIDGSEEGVRFPHYRPSISRDGEVVVGPPTPEDPLVGPLREADFTPLRPGQSFDPTQGDRGASYSPIFTFSNFAPTTPGTYSYELTLSTASEQSEQWLGRFAQDDEREAVLALLERVPRLTVASNVLAVTVQ